MSLREKGSCMCAAESAADISKRGMEHDCPNALLVTLTLHLEVPIARAIKRAKKELAPSAETQERVEWTVVGITVIFGTVVAVEVLAAIAAIMM